MTGNKVGNIASANKNQFDNSSTQTEATKVSSISPPRTSRPEEKERRLRYITLKEVRTAAAWKPPRNSESS